MICAVFRAHSYNNLDKSCHAAPGRQGIYSVLVTGLRNTDMQGSLQFSVMLLRLCYEVLSAQDTQKVCLYLHFDLIGLDALIQRAHEVLGQVTSIIDSSVVTQKVLHRQEVHDASY